MLLRMKNCAMAEVRFYVSFGCRVVSAYRALRCVEQLQLLRYNMSITRYMDPWQEHCHVWKIPSFDCHANSKTDTSRISSYTSQDS